MRRHLPKIVTSMRTGPVRNEGSGRKGKPEVLQAGLQQQ